MKRALVLAGGGMRGAYEAGAIKALEELGIEFHLVTGVSIGALNGVLFIQNGADSLVELWNSMDQTLVFKGKIPMIDNLEVFLKDADLLIPLLKNYVKDKGVDIEPFERLLRERFDEKKLHESEKDIGMIMLEVPKLQPIVATKDMLRGEDGISYLLGSSACFPAFPLAKHNDKLYLDGGYYDNLPIDLAFEMGATEVVAIDLTYNPTHPQFMNRDKVKYIKPQHSLGLMFDVNPKNMKRNMKLGYLETKKAYGYYDGISYTFIKEEKDLFPSDFYIQLLRQDHRCKKVWKILDDRLVYNKLCKDNSCVSLTEREVHFAIIEQIMRWKQKRPEILYSLKEEIDFILEECKEAMEPGYELVPPMNIKSMIDHLQEMSRMELMKRILHQEIYPDAVVIAPKLLETVFSIETAVARWIKEKMREEN